MTSWNVISAGPSAAQVTADDLLDGPTVAINSAIRRIDDGLPIRYWCVHEPPQGLWRRHHDELAGWLPQVTVWCRECFDSSLWRRTYPGARLETYDKAKWGPPWAPGSSIWGTTGRSLITGGALPAGLSGCIHRGATQIRLFGVDLQGVGGFAHFEPTAGTRSKRRRQRLAWEDRWRRERAQLDRMVADAKAHGVEIQHVVREPECSTPP